MGVSQLATLAYASGHDVYAPRASIKDCRSRISKAQVKLSRQVKFSNNWRKQKEKLQRLHRHVSHIRRDHLHKISDEISKNHAMIIIEDLKVVNMTKSAKGSIDAPGRHVKAKLGLNRSI